MELNLIIQMPYENIKKSASNQIKKKNGARRDRVTPESNILHYKGTIQTILTTKIIRIKAS